MKKLIINLTAFVILAVGPQTVEAAQPLNVGVVNFKTCVEQSKLGSAEQKGFEEKKKQMEEVLQDKEKTLNEIAAKFNDPDYLDSLSQEAEAEMKHKFRTLSQEMQQYQQQYFQILNQENFRVIQKISGDIQEAAKTVAKNKNLDLILNEEMAFFYANALDVSDDVIKVMDQNYKGE